MRLALVLAAACSGAAGLGLPAARVLHPRTLERERSGVEVAGIVIGSAGLLASGGMAAWTCCGAREKESRKQKRSATVSGRALSRMITKGSALLEEAQSVYDTAVDLDGDYVKEVNTLNERMTDLRKVLRIAVSGRYSALRPAPPPPRPAPPLPAPLPRPMKHTSHPRAQRRSRPNPVFSKHAAAGARRRRTSHPCTSRRRRARPRLTRCALTCRLPRTSFTRRP